jgi:hypothetical protein
VVVAPWIKKVIVDGSPSAEVVVGLVPETLFHNTTDPDEHAVDALLAPEVKFAVGQARRIYVKVGPAVEA